MIKLERAVLYNDKKKILIYISLSERNTAYHQKYSHLQLHVPFNFDIASNMQLQFLEYGLQRREGLMIF